MNPDYPQWLIDATPGASEAIAAIEAATAVEAETTREWKAAQKISFPLGHWIGTGPADAQRVKKPDVSTEEYEAATARTRETQAVMKRAEARRESATKALDELMRSGSFEDRKVLAARQALIQHEVVQSAWALLLDAMTNRDRALHYAGDPGLSWDRSVWNAGGKLIEMRQLMTAYIDGLDRRALDLAADGEDIPDYVAEAEKRVFEHNRRVAGLTRQRDRREQRGQA